MLSLTVDEILAVSAFRVIVIFFAELRDQNVCMITYSQLVEIDPYKVGFLYLSLG